MPIEAVVNWFSDFDINQPQDGDYIVEGDNHIRNLKKAILAQFPSLGNAAMNATAAQLNYLSGVTAGTAAINKALVLDSSGSIATIASLTATGLITNSLTRNSAGNLSISAASGNVAVEGITFNGTEITGATNITSTNFTGNATSASTAAACSGNSATASNFNSVRTFNATGGDVTGTDTDSGGNYTVSLNIGNDKVTNAKLTSPAAGTTVIKRKFGVTDIFQYVSAAYDSVDILADDVGTINLGTVLVTGTIRVHARLSRTGGTAACRINVNGSTVYTSPNYTGASWPSYTSIDQDIAVTIGDVITLQTTNNGSTTILAEVQARSNTANMAIA